VIVVVALSKVFDDEAMLKLETKLGAMKTKLEVVRLVVNDTKTNQI